MPKLVAMVSLYNSGQWLENRLDNLLEASVPGGLEIWCYNADSPDVRDREIGERYTSANPDRIKYIQGSDRIGVYAAWNRIIEASQSDYLTNANTDDIVASDCYAKLVSVLESRPEVGHTYPSWRTTARENQRWSTLADADFGGEPGSYAGDIELAGVGHFPLWRRSLHDHLGLFDEEFKALGDCDWWARCFWRGKSQFHWHREYLACYLYRHGENLWHRSVTPEEWGRYHQKLQEYMNG